MYCTTHLKERKKAVTEFDIKVREHDLKSSNLSHFSAIIHAATNLPKVRKILRPFRCKDRRDSLVVDIVAQDGRIWVKVIARKAQALHLIWAGRGQYGDRDIVRQAEDYLKCAAEHTINFIIPEIHYAFYNEVTDVMATALEDIGVKVWGKRIPVSTDVQHLVENSGSYSDDEYDVYNRIKSVSDEEENDNEEDGDFHIPNASEFKSCYNRLKQLEKIEITQKQSEPGDLSNDKRRYSGLIESQTTCIEKGNANSLKSMSLTIQSNHGKNILNVSNINDRYQEYSQSTNCPNKQDILLKILGSVPTYSFADTVVPEVIQETTGDVLEANGVNLDITTMITLVSSISHGGCNFIFRENILSLQAKEERECPVLPALQQYLKGKEMYVCKTALDDFQTILNTLGGENEKRRAAELLEKCKMVSDQPSVRSQNLPKTGKIRDRSKIIFGTGDQLKCVTVSANSGFVRAAEHQGIVFAVYLHQSRALTEKKEFTAEKVPDITNQD
ncbi:UPF0415 protein C7orf25 homolog [Mytilus californianus]|uniref:UPF0415 protein C7orf25 homolog n=1 Tax=Mytilus californianus TaxID=6549 RepID=UPI0022475DC6|nr:UPF0415 protein C7orf25 homolog [Mytilus californianus]